MNQEPDITSSSQSAAKLIFSTGDGPTVYELKGERVTIGRTEENEVVLDDASVSSRHAEIVEVDGQWILWDLGSSNGTTVNGQAVTESKLAGGDSIGFAGMVCLFVDETRSSQASRSTLVTTGRRIAHWAASLSRSNQIILVVGLLMLLAATLYGFRKVTGSKSDQEFSPEPMDLARETPTPAKYPWATPVPVDVRQLAATNLSLDASRLGSAATKIPDYFSEMDSRYYDLNGHRALRRFELSYRALDQLMLWGNEQIFDPDAEPLPGSFRPGSFVELPGTEIRLWLQSDELRKFILIHDKYNEWRQLAIKEKLLPGVRKLITTFGKTNEDAPVEVTFVTPDLIEFGSVRLKPKDFELLIDVIGGLPAWRERLYTRIARDDRDMHERLKKRAEMEVLRTRETQRARETLK